MQNQVLLPQICHKPTTDVDLVGFILKMLMQGEAQNAALPLAGCPHPQLGHEVQHHRDVRTKQALVYGCNSAGPSWKDVFSSYFCAHAEDHHLLCSTAAPAIVFCTGGLPPTPPLACNDAVPFDTGVAYFKSTLHWVFQKPPGNFPGMGPFPSSLLRAPVHSCDP